MGRTFKDDYDILARVDPAKDLDDKSVRISSAGIKWMSVLGPESLGLSSAQMLDFYHYMALMRRVDREIISLSRKGMAFGKHLPGIGNEATAIGTACALDRNDWMTLGIRDMGVFLVRGLPIEKLLMQACGKKDGPTNGWDGSLHMGYKDKRVIGLISHLGTSAVIATGCAFNEKYRKTDNVALTFCGDGTTSTGDVHEAINIASVMRLPFIMVVENNQWAFGTPNQFEFNVPTLALRALSYGPNVEGYWIDGTNVLTVYSTVKMALERARKNNIVSIIEATTMRSEGHSLADPFTTYVSAEQLDIWKRKDPIDSYKNLLLSRAIASDSDLIGIDAAIEEQLRIAVEITEKALPPDESNFRNKVFFSKYREACSGSLSVSPKEGRKITYHEAIHEALEEILRKDQDVFLIGEDIGISGGAFKITKDLSQKFDGINWQTRSFKKEYLEQRRVIDAPIAEAGICGLALGSLLGGLKAIVEFQYADFSSEAFKMIVNYAATQNVRNMGPLHIVFRMPSGWALNTSIYHSVNPESWFASTPGLKIVAPVTAFDAKGLLKASLYDGNPVLFLEYKHYYRRRPETLPPEMDLNVPEREYWVPIGKARVVKEGSDISVVTYGSQIFRVLEAVQEIENKSEISVEVIDLRTIVPYDKECVSASVRKTGKVLVTCEAPRTGCFGNTIAQNIQEENFEYLDAPVRLLAAADTPVPFAPQLEEIHLPTKEKLVRAIEELIKY